MKISTASTRTEGLLSLFDNQTEFFIKALDGMAEEDRHKRLNTAANHPAWITGSLVQQRFLMASEMNHTLRQTGEELFKNNKGIQEEVQYPTLADYRKDWEAITPVARQALVRIDDKKLDSDLDMGGMKMTYYAVICFTIYREANMIGQLALWRRLLGYPGLKY